MNHLKKLGLLALAAAAVMAFVGVASASAAEFHTSQSNPSLEGTQVEGEKHVFKVGGTEVKCANAEFTGTGTGTTSETQEMHPKYGECFVGGSIPATVNTEGCQYKFNANTTTVEIKSCTNGFITINATSVFNTRCHVIVKDSSTTTPTPEEQTHPYNAEVNGISFENMNGHAGPFTVKAASTNIHYEVLVSTGLCPLTQGETGTNAAYTGNTEVEANSGASEIWIE